MKYLLIISLLFSFNSFSQIASTTAPLIRESITTYTYTTTNYSKDVFKFEIYTAKGVIVFGVAETKEHAQWIVDDFYKRNAKTVFKPYNYVIKKSITTKRNYFDRFKSICPKGYKVLTQRDIIAFRIIKVDGVGLAIDFIQKTTAKNAQESNDYVYDLSSNLKDYRIGY